MKRLSELTTADLERTPVWRYDGSTDETALVRATARTELSSGENDRFIARTQFVLGNGEQFIGFCSPCDQACLEYLQPVIVTPAGLVHFWFDVPPTSESLEAQWRRLEPSREAIFPVHFRCTVPLDGEYITGTIEEGDLTGAA